MNFLRYLSLDKVFACKQKITQENDFDDIDKNKSA